MKTNPAVTPGFVVVYDRKTGTRCEILGTEDHDRKSIAVLRADNHQREIEIPADNLWAAYTLDRDEAVRPGLQVKARSDGAHYAVVASNRANDNPKFVELTPIGDCLNNPDLIVSGNRFWDMFEPLAESDAVKDSDGESDVVKDSDGEADDISDTFEDGADDYLSLIERFALEAPVPFTTSQRHDLDVAIASNAVDDVAAIMDRNVRLRYDFAEAMMRERAKRTGEQ